MNPNSVGFKREMLAIPGLSRASPVSWVITRSCLSRKWGRLEVRSCATQETSGSTAPKSAAVTAFQSPFPGGLDGLAALIALSGSGSTIGKDAKGNVVIKHAGSGTSKEIAVEGAGDVKKKKVLKAKGEEDEKPNPKYVRSPKVKKVPTPEPKYSKAARRFFNMKFRKAERLSKVMAAAGVASRRACEDIIFSGKVVVNGKVCKVPETHVDPLKDLIYINGKTIPRRLPPKMVFALYKPKGYICSDSKDDKKTVYLLFEKFIKTWTKSNPGITKPRFFTVGRLDVGTTGLLFITNDGEFAQKVSHPSSGITKEYIVTVGETVTKKQIRRIASGTEIDGVLCVPISVELLTAEPGDSKKRLRIIVSEGRNHEVRRLVENAFLQVQALKRVRVGGLRLPSKLTLGNYIQLTDAQIKQVTEQDPFLPEEDEEEVPLALSSSKKQSTALVVKKEDAVLASNNKQYPLVTERKEVRAVIETSSNKPLMIEQVQKMVSRNIKNPTRRVRPLIFK